MKCLIVHSRFQLMWWRLCGRGGETRSYNAVRNTLQNHRAVGRESGRGRHWKQPRMGTILVIAEAHSAEANRYVCC